MLPYGVPFDSLSFLYLTSGHFFDLKILLGLSRFLTRQFFIPRCGSYAMLPYGVPFDSLSFLYLPSSHFFGFKILLGLSRFLALRFFILTDGWMDGWMDGWDGWDGWDGRETFFLSLYLVNYLTFFITRRWGL